MLAGWKTAWKLSSECQVQPLHVRKGDFRHACPHCAERFQIRDPQKGNVDAVRDEIPEERAFVKLPSMRRLGYGDIEVSILRSGPKLTPCQPCYTATKSDCSSLGQALLRFRHSSQHFPILHLVRPPLCLLQFSPKRFLPRLGS